MEERIDIITDIRGFNRFYTNVLGLLNMHIVNSDYSLTEARIIYEVSKTEHCTANQLSNVLKIDTGYLSRTIKKLEKEKILERHIRKQDARVNEIALTESGQQLFRRINEDSNNQISRLLSSLKDEECAEINHAMNVIKKHLTRAMNDLRIRRYEKDDADIEYVIDRQLSLYEAERHFTSEVWKKYLVEGVLQLVEHFDDARDCMLILECNKNRSGCVAITHTEEKTAQLRYFFLEPELRGIGAGRKMLAAAIDFCKEKGYEKIFLWTVSAQETARYLYGSAGFKVTETSENNQWGAPVLEERWDLCLKC